MRRIDLTGKRFGRLVVLGFVDVRNGNSRWLCRCDCGEEKTVFAFDLKSSNTRSCGCLNRETIKNFVHGHRKNRRTTKTYRVWRDMLTRCLNKNRKCYKNYGGRGIRVCDRWLKFENFLEDMGECPNAEYSIDRINNDGDYTPVNCKWVTLFEQARNKRVNHWIEYKNKKMILMDWANLLHISYTTINYHLKRGMIMRDILEYLSYCPNVSYYANLKARELLKES